VEIEKNRINFKKTVAVSIIIIIANLSLLGLGTLNIISPMSSVAGTGIVTFFGMLMLTNLLSRTRYLDKGEMRKSLAASIIVTYFSLIAFHTNELLSNTMIGHFTYIVGIVIAFYFGGRIIESVKKSTDKNNVTSTEEKTETSNTSNTKKRIEPKLCVITTSHLKDKNNNSLSFSNDGPLNREIEVKWNKSVVTYALIKGTIDIRENSDVTEKTAMNLAMLTWGLEIPLKLKLVKKDENPDITVNFKHTDEDEYLAKRKHEGNNILGYAFPPEDEQEGTLVLNDDYLWSVTGKPIDAWKVDPEHYSPGDATTFKTWNLTSTLIHELGHTLGVPHIDDCPECIMYQKDNENVDLHNRDIEIIQRKYGNTNRSDAEYLRLKEWLKQRIRREPSNN